LVAGKKHVIIAAYGLCHLPKTTQIQKKILKTYQKVNYWKQLPNPKPLTLNPEPYKNP